jgi:parallel beta-helix repeat protein
MGEIMNRYKKYLSIFVVFLFILNILPSSSIYSMKITNNKTIKEYNEFLKEENDYSFVDLLTKSKNHSLYVNGEIIVKFKEKIKLNFIKTSKGIFSGEKSLDILNNEYELKSTEKIFSKISSDQLSNIYKLSFSERINILEAIKSYNQLSVVEYAEPNYFYKYCIEPNDPLYPQQWALNNIEQDYPWDGRFNAPPGTFDCDIDAPEAWNITTGNENITMAIIDTGVDYNHPDLANNIWINDDEIPDNLIDDDNNGYIDDIRGWDFQDNDNDPMDDYDGQDNPLDASGHGTFCAGISCAIGNNGEGISGVGWNCKIMPIKTILTSSLLAKCLEYAVDNDADVISMSYGGYIYSQLQSDVIDYAYNKNVILVGSAGNDNVSRRHYPSGYDKVISVAATDSNDEKAIFSNYGPWVDVAAPGVDVLGLRAKNTDMYGDNIHIVDEDYYFASGTSMSAPYVSGIAALLLSYNRSLTPDMIKTIIINSADKLSSVSFYIGGRTNAYQTLQKNPAIVLLEQFVDWTNINGNIEIIGKIWGTNFEEYILEYGWGENPETWITITKGYSPIDDIITNLDSTQLDEGYYTIRLTVNCSGDTYQDKIWIIVNNECNTIYIDDDNKDGPWTGSLEYPFKKIQDGITQAGDGDTVFVFNGTYYENVKVNRAINLVGEDKNNTIIDGGENGSVVQILANYVTVKNFTIQNCERSLFEAGIKLEIKIHHVLIKNNLFLETYCGIYLSYNDDNEIIDNNLPNSTILLFLGCLNNTISNNRIENSEVAIGLSLSYFNNISENTILNNEYGLLITYSIQNSITNNNISNNENGVIILIMGQHKIYSNNFINNGIHARIISSRFNRWKNNYWDDWIGLKRPFLKFLPKYIPSIVPRIISSFDWHPASEPYDI